VATDEFDATFLSDGRSVVFARSTDLENQPIALYFAALGPGGYTAPILLPASVNVANGATLGPSSSGDVLYFSGKRPEASAGKLDIYRVRYTLARAAPTSRLHAARPQISRELGDRALPEREIRTDAGEQEEHRRADVRDPARQRERDGVVVAGSVGFCPGMPKKSRV